MKRIIFMKSGAGGFYSGTPFLNLKLLILKLYIFIYSEKVNKID